MKNICNVRILVITAFLLSGITGTGVAEKGLVGEWHFDETAEDTSGNGNHGSVHGATFVEGISGQALCFEETGDFVQIEDNLSLALSGDYTVEFWFKFISPPQAPEVMISKWIAHPKIFYVGYFPSGFVSHFRTTEEGTHFSSSWQIIPEVNKWYYVAAVTRGNDLEIFGNGELRGSENWPAVTSVGRSPVAIGRNNQINGQNFHGIIDEVRIYNRALSAEEIRMHYEQGQTALTVTEEIYPHSIEISYPSEIGNSSAVLLHGEKTDVVLGEDILLKLSAVNLITKPPMSVQVMIYPPSGMSVTGSEFVKSGAGIYTTTYTLNPGDGKDIEVHIKSNQVGDFNAKGRIVYYFGEDKDKAEDHTLNLLIKVRKEAAPQQGQTQAPNSNPSTAGFEAIISIGGLLLIYLTVKWQIHKRKNKYRNEKLRQQRLRID